MKKFVVNLTFCCFEINWLVLNYLVTIDRDVKRVSFAAEALINDVPLPLPVPNPNACVNSGLVCPLKKDETYTYVLKLPVERDYPSVRKLNKFL